MFVVAVVIIPALFATISAVAVHLQNNSTTNVTVEEGRDVILHVTFGFELSSEDDVRIRWTPPGATLDLKLVVAFSHGNVEIKLSDVHNVYASRALPGQLYIVLRNVSRSVAGSYDVTVRPKKDSRFKFWARMEVRVVPVFMSVDCRATLTDDDTTTLVCSVEYADTDSDHPEVEWSESSTYCVTKNETSTPSSMAGRRIRTATCSGASSTVRETVRTCAVRSTHNATLGVLWMKCSVDIWIGHGGNSELESSTKPTGSVSELQLTTADLGQSEGTDRTDGQGGPRAGKLIHDGNGSAGERTVSSSGLVHYLLFGLFAFVRHLF